MGPFFFGEKYKILEKVEYIMCAFFWVIPWHLNFIKFRCRGITQKKAYNIEYRS